MKQSTTSEPSKLRRSMAKENLGGGARDEGARASSEAHEKDFESVLPKVLSNDTIDSKNHMSKVKATNEVGEATGAGTVAAEAAGAD